MMEFDFIPILACNPALLMIAQVAISAGAAGAQAISAKRTAEATAKHQRQVGERINAQTLATQSALQEQRVEGEQAAFRQREAWKQKAMVASARVRASGLEAGAEGQSLDAALAEFDMRDAQQIHASYIGQNIAANRYRRHLYSLSQQNRARMTTNFRPINQPNYAAYGLQAAAGAASAYGGYLDRGVPSVKPSADSPSTYEKWKGFRYTGGD